MRIWREAQNRLGFVLETTLQLLLLHFLHCPCSGYFGHLFMNKENATRVLLTTDETTEMRAGHALSEQHE
jgi:hypothetical protein